MNKENPRHMEKKLTITSFAWRNEIAEKLRRVGYDAPSEQDILDSLVAFARFLENRGLVTRKLLENEGLIEGKRFALYNIDLTELGRAVLRSGMGGWEKCGCPANNLRPLERAYKKVTVNKS